MLQFVSKKGDVHTHIHALQRKTGAAEMREGEGDFSLLKN